MRIAFPNLKVARSAIIFCSVIDAHRYSNRRMQEVDINCTISRRGHGEIYHYLSLVWNKIASSSAKRDERINSASARYLSNVHNLACARAISIFLASNEEKPLSRTHSRYYLHLQDVKNWSVRAFGKNWRDLTKKLDAQGKMNQCRYWSRILLGNMLHLFHISCKSSLFSEDRDNLIPCSVNIILEKKYIKIKKH